MTVLEQTGRGSSVLHLHGEELSCVTLRIFCDVLGGSDCHNAATVIAALRAQIDNPISGLGDV